MNKKLLLVFVLLLVVVVGVVSGVYILRQRQSTDIREEASVPTGDSTISLSPSTSTLSPGEPAKISVLFNPNAVAISGVAVKLTYTYSEVTSPVSASNIVINPGLLSSGEWNCPVSQFNAAGGTATLDISCFNTNPNGFTSSVDTLLATFDLTATAVPEINPIVVSFDPEQSIIASVTTGADVLLIPTSTGQYRVRSTGTTGFPTPDPSGSVATGSATPTATPTIGGVRTPTPTATSAPSTLPDTGVATPTLIGIALAILLMGGIFLLAI